MTETGLGPSFTGARQLLLPLTGPEAPGTWPFFPGSNAEALAAIDHLECTAYPLCLRGSPGVGKTHLLQRLVAAGGRWGPYVDARLTDPQELSADPLQLAPLLSIDHLEAWVGVYEAERALFQLYNRRRDLGLPWAMACQGMTPIRWGLPDWQSRFESCETYWLDAPDDALLEKILGGMFSRCGRILPPDLGRYLLRHQRRNPGALEPMVRAFDRWLRQHQAPATITQWQRFMREEQNGRLAPTAG